MPWRPSLRTRAATRARSQTRARQRRPSRSSGVFCGLPDVAETLVRPRRVGARSASGADWRKSFVAPSAGAARTALSLRPSAWLARAALGTLASHSSGRRRVRAVGRRAPLRGAMTAHSPAAAVVGRRRRPATSKSKPTRAGSGRGRTPRKRSAPPRLPKRRSLPRYGGVPGRSGTSPTKYAIGFGPAASAGSPRAAPTRWRPRRSSRARSRPPPSRALRRPRRTGSPRRAQRGPFRARPGATG